MGYGHAVPQTVAVHRARRAHGLPVDDKDTGYPVPREEVRGGYMRDDEIMEGFNAVSPEEIKSTTRSGHNEMRIETFDGRIFYRLRETDIVVIDPRSFWAITINTGGWNTPTTRRHVMNILSRHRVPSNFYGSKRRKSDAARNVLKLFYPDGRKFGTYRFGNRVGVPMPEGGSFNAV